ncbi:hypothetical protein QE382_004356 [Sphingobacterium zeae]|uniref:Bacteriophage abortive infection AbiH n=1 Tax=Sphingobacterium zeae TaxID=1776859 RepID=A0ABU0UBX7_9SPHI|nr:AbiH family protein [Sphingobacterium zeae]MDQ1152372.1 hypothetical protein [Sphingobacterium zeae]
MIKDERINKIFLIGNGFDLAHRLPTRYIDFITWYLKDCCFKAIEKGYYKDDCLTVKINLGIFHNGILSVERELDRCFESKEIWEFITVHSPGLITFTGEHRGRYDHSWTIKIDPVNEFSSNLFFNCRNADWSGIEYEINRIMLKQQATLAKSRTLIMIDRKTDARYVEALKEIKQLNLSVYHLKAKLIEYLKLNNEPEESKHELMSNKNRVDWGKKYYKNANGQVFCADVQYFGNKWELNRNVLFLNFNYTTYFEDKIVKNLKSEFKDNFTYFQTIYIHGDLNQPTDEIVFGVGDENKEIYSEIESLYDDDWLVPLKSFHYFRNTKYQELLGFIGKGDYEIYVIGHSCSTTDRTLLNMLFESDACKRIHVYHYSGIDSYLTSAYNIARNFNDKVRLRRVLQPFNEKLSTKS